MSYSIFITITITIIITITITITITIGANIIILIDFKGQEKVCHKISTYLKSEEIVAASYNRNSNTKHSLQAKILNEIHHHTQYNKYLSYSIPVPLQTDVSFSIPQVTLTHTIQFDFMVNTDSEAFINKM